METWAIRVTDEPWSASEAAHRTPSVERKSTTRYGDEPILSSFNNCFYAQKHNGIYI
ncbi:hypothetical protein [Lysinibacillus sp. fls2-241-R2A-57]|uniref:hypothetical protein n=1 Tax=Lysinibacillus sp. fls2-241-R2A-57 TaxID=3040292 RepID=UPI002554E134|nr:hypothetical protein [Lysinibacillus sp. fls2-241-R2A-57]